MRRLLGLAAVLTLLLVVFWVLQPFDSEELRRWVDGFGPLAPVVYVIAGGVLGALLVSGPLLAGASGLLFGVWTGFFVTLGSATLSALIAWWIGRRAGADALEDVAGERVGKLAAFARRHGMWAVIVQRFIPGAPDGLCNYAFGVVAVSALAMIGGTVLGSAPRAFAYTALGDSLANPFSPLGLVAIGVMILTSVAGVIIAMRMRRAGRL